MSVQLPDMIRYSKALNAVGVDSKFNLRRLRPQTSNGGYSSSNRTITIPISGQDLFIDTNRSYLTAKLTVVAATNPVFLDNSFYSLIDSIRVLSGSGGVIEEIANYNFIANRLADFNLSVDERQGIRGKCAGFSNSGAPSTTSPISFAAGTTSKYFTVPIVASGVMNMSSKAHNGGVFLPAALMNGGLFLEINLAPNVNDPFYTDAAAAGTLTSWTLDDVSYDAAVISFDSAVVNQLKMATEAAGGVLLSSYTYHGQTVSAGSSDAVSLNLNERANSIRSIYVQPRLDDQNNNIQRTVFSSLAPTATNINAFLQIASQYYPNVPLQNLNDCERELMKALGTDCAGMVSRDFYEDSTAADVTTTLSGGSAITKFPRFTLGFDTESFRELLESGISNKNNSQPIIVNMTYGTTAVRSYVIHTLVDMIVRIDGATREVTSSY